MLLTIDDVRANAQTLAEGDYQKHAQNGVSLNPFSTVMARHEWARGFDGEVCEAMDYNAEYQRGRAARAILNKGD